ncbi:MAG: 5-formyltetrahydrofolate cyclo-ligase [Gemmatimonadota bacterium]
MTGAAGGTKAQLRHELRRRVAALSGAKAESLSVRACARLLHLPEVAHARSLLVCLSFGHEIDTRALIGRLAAEGRTVFVPRAVPGTTRLTVHRWPCVTETLSFGLEQPAGAAAAITEGEIDGRIDVAILVGVSFDERAYRLGYGAGYFDRFLEGRPFPAVGLAYEAQILPELPVEPHDVQLAAVVTEERVIRPS